LLAPGEIAMARRLAAILAADVVGYSRLMAADEQGTHARLKALRQDFIEPKIAEHHGRIAKLMGDGALVEFASVVDAVECAAAIQAGVAARQAELPEDQQISLRIGINIGDVIIEGDDIYGDGVNVAARLEALAEPGAICVSRTVYNHTKAKVAFGFEPMGEHRVKNIPEPITVYRLVTDPGPMAKVLGLKRAAAPRWRWMAVAAVAVVLLAAGGIAVWQQLWVGSVESSAPKEPAAPVDDPVLAIPSGPSIAVLPFDNLSGDPDQEYFADGLTEDVISKLTRFRDLLVIARNSTHRYKGQQVDVRQVGRELGARYVVEGSVRRAADTVRVTTQLIDASNGAHLWAESYEADLTAGDIFALQDQITNQLVNVIADAYGVLARTNLRESKKKPPESLDAYDCVLRGYGYLMVYTAEAHLEARDCLERAVKIDPDYSDAWAWLTWMYQDEYLLNFNPRPEPLERALQAAQRAVDLDQMNQLAHHVLAVCHFLRREDDLFLTHAERALAINSNNAAFIGDIGIFMVGVGEWGPRRGPCTKSHAPQPLSRRHPVRSVLQVPLPPRRV
jgi:adenylate cyclase